MVGTAAGLNLGCPGPALGLELGSPRSQDRWEHLQELGEKGQLCSMVFEGEIKPAEGRE